MEVDNDEDSSWVQIHENMKILAGSLQAAVRGFWSFLVFIDIVNQYKKKNEQFAQNKSWILSLAFNDKKWSKK